MPEFSNYPSALAVPEEQILAPGYPERFRVRLAGRVEQVWLPALQDKPMYRAELVVAKSKPLQWSSPLALIGMPIVEPPGEDFEEESEDPEKQHHLNTASLATAEVAGAADGARRACRCVVALFRCGVGESSSAGDL